MINSKNIKGQSAMEYLITYGWALIVIIVVLGLLYSLGVLNPSSYASTECVFPADFSCSNVALLSNGLLTFTLTQSTQNPIQITALGCNSNSTQLGFTAITPVTMQIGNNVTISLQCFVGTTLFSANHLGQIFSGSVEINYTDTQDYLPNQITGFVVQKSV